MQRKLTEAEYTDLQKRASARFALYRQTTKSTRSADTAPVGAMETIVKKQLQNICKADGSIHLNGMGDLRILAEAISKGLEPTLHFSSGCVPFGDR